MNLKAGMKALKGPLIGIGGLILTTVRRDIISLYSMVYDRGLL